VIQAASGTSSGSVAQAAATLRYVPNANRGTFAIDVAVRKGGQLVPLCFVNSAEGGPAPGGLEATIPC
jgi:hypothetical protein